MSLAGQYSALFVSAFLSATLLPGTSEVLFSSLVAAGGDTVMLTVWATAGNTLGSMFNWTLGRWLIRFQDRSWFPFKEEKLELSRQWFNRWGVFTLLFAWLPVVGDPLTFIAGLMKVRLPVFILLTAPGKAARYAVLAGAMQLFFTGR